MFYFYGEWNYTLDEKGRIPIPPPFRSQLKECIITLGDTGNVRLYRGRGDLPFSKVYRIKPDKEWRVKIPPQIKPQLPKMVKWVGEGEYLELKRR